MRVLVKKEEGNVRKKIKNKTALGVWGTLFVIFGLSGTIPILINREYILGLPVTAILVIIGVVLIGKAISE